MIIRITMLFALLMGTAALAQETQKRYLSGRGNDDAIPWEFFWTSGAKSGQWTAIPVPSCWDALGFGALNYQHDKEPFEQGKYRRQFAVPADWKGMKIFVVF